jgi:hypothetical protein
MHHATRTNCRSRRRPHDGGRPPQSLLKVELLTMWLVVVACVAAASASPGASRVCVRSSLSCVVTCWGVWRAVGDVPANGLLPPLPILSADFTLQTVSNITYAFLPKQVSFWSPGFRQDDPEAVVRALASAAVNLLRVWVLQVLEGHTRQHATRRRVGHHRQQRHHVSLAVWQVTKCSTCRTCCTLFSSSIDVLSSGVSQCRCRGVCSSSVGSSLRQLTCAVCKAPSWCCRGLHAPRMCRACVPVSLSWRVLFQRWWRQLHRGL